MRNYPTILVPSITWQFKQCGWVELPRTYETISYDSCSLNYSVVQAVRLVSTTWTYGKFSYDPSSVNYSVVKAVWMSELPDSWNILLQSLFLQLLGSSSSSATLNYTEHMRYFILSSLFPEFLGSSSSSTALNHPKHMRNYSMTLVPSITGYFKQFDWVELPQTHETLS